MHCVNKCKIVKRCLSRKRKKNAKRLSHHDGKVRVFRRKGERFTDACVVEIKQAWRGWDGIMGDRQTDLICE